MKNEDASLMGIRIFNNFLNPFHLVLKDYFNVDFFAFMKDKFAFS